MFGMGIDVVTGVEGYTMITATRDEQDQNRISLKCDSCWTTVLALLLAGANAVAIGLVAYLAGRALASCA